MNKEELMDRLGSIVGKPFFFTSDMDLLLYGYDASLIRGKEGPVTSRKGLIGLPLSPAVF
jgi:hypothetical protein